MSRLVIDVTGDQHQHIKAMAALQGKSIKNFVLAKLFDENEDEQHAWNQLEQLLSERIESAQTGNLSTKTIHQIAEKKLTELKTNQ